MLAMPYEVVRAAEVTRDLELIFDLLVTVADELGESPNRAFARAEKRLAEIEAAMADLGRLPHRGTRRPHPGADIRNVTKPRGSLLRHR